jgi:Cu(I)/Ag(I) efflux system membrane fusion protein
LQRAANAICFTFVSQIHIMKRSLLLSLLVILIASCGGNKDQAATETAAVQMPLGKSAHTDSFNLAFGAMLDAYFQLKEQFIRENDTLVTARAKDMLFAIGPTVSQITDTKDSTIITTALSYTSSISGELKGLLGEEKLDDKRKSFQLVSEQLYDLIRTVRYDREVVYHQFCPMAFNDAGGFWLSNSSDIRNPYLPKTMLVCGEVKDSLDFR